MFSVLFEVHPKTGQWDAYLGYARLLRPELELVEGFIDNIHYRSLTREGWLLSLSGWRDEKALIRWRTQALHHDVQQKGRFQVFRDYHLRVTQDTRPPAGHVLHEQRLEETETGAATTVTLIDITALPETGHKSPHEIAEWLGLDPYASGLVTWDVFDAELTPGDMILQMSWRDPADAEAFEEQLSLRDGAQLRRVRVVRDYGMLDRREAPQYYPDVKRAD